MYKVIGIDEAGRGPVLGSLFIGFSIIVLGSLKDLNEYQDMLSSLGVRDSKKLSPKKRAALYEVLKEKMDMKFAQLTPALIDSNNAQGGTLNALQVEAIVRILEMEKPDLVLIDALTSSPEKYGDELLARLSFECKIIAENKADDTFSLVGAASIIAKELREQELGQLRAKLPEILGADCLSCGSGYPSDAVTVAFLKAYHSDERINFVFRKSWASYKDAVKSDGQKTLSEF